MAKRLEKLPRRRSSQAWPRSAVQQCFDVARSHIARARGFLAVADSKYAMLSLDDACHAHELARQLLRGIRN
jgi:hypothetical protein